MLAQLVSPSMISRSHGKSLVALSKRISKSFGVILFNSSHLFFLRQLYPGNFRSQLLCLAILEVSHQLA